MRSIDSFTFIKTDGTFQQAIVPNGRESRDTLLTCERGDKVCVFTTKLDDAFFTSNGDVTGIGEAHLEFVDTENGDLRHLRRRRAQYTDVKFAGTWEVELSFQVIKSEPEKKYDLRRALLSSGTRATRPTGSTRQPGAKPSPRQQCSPKHWRRSRRWKTG